MANDQDRDPTPVRVPEGTGAVDADAAVRFGSTSDRMKVGVSRYTPARGKGKVLSVDLLRQAMADAGIVVPLDEKNAAEAVQLLLAGKDAGRIAIARGLRPRSAQDSWVELEGGLNFPVFPGMVFGRLHPAQQSAEGLDVAGNPVPPEDPRKPRELVAAGDGSCSLARDGFLTAQVYGLVRISDTQVAVEPLVRVSADRLSATATLYARDALGAEVSPDLFMKGLARQGVCFGVLEERIEAALAQSSAENRPIKDVVVAEGLPPEHGRPGRLEHLYAELSAVGTEDESGRMDYRDRGLFPVVEQGWDIARLHTPTKGIPGRDVFDQAVPARGGAPLQIRAGKNVETLEEGALFRAKIKGAVLARKNALDVSELLDLDGDVDISSGNIQLSHGSVLVKGTVRTGFTVQAPQNVFVGGEVESARVIAGGDVIVRGGIFMAGDEAAFVRAEGSVSAAYAHNAQVHAGGDVTISLCITCSMVRAGFRVTSGGFVRITDPKGRIMGGAVVCAEGLEVFEAGSAMGRVATTLALSHESPELRALIQEKRELKAFLVRAIHVLGDGDGLAALASMPAERKAEAEELLAKRDDAERRLDQIARTLAELAQEELAQAGRARIIIRGVAHPGVVIKMGGRTLHVDRPIERSQFFWDVEKREISVGSL